MARKYAWIFVCGHVWSYRRTVVREHSLKKNIGFEKQIMSKDKYPSMFLRQMEAIVFIILRDVCPEIDYK